MATQFEEYVRPQSVSEAVRLLRAPDAYALAGGTHLLQLRPTDAKVVVDLQDLPLDYVRQDGDGVHIGALTKVESFATHAVLSEIGDGFLARCARLAAANTERRAATIGGTLATSGWNDLLLALMVTDAWARLAWSDGVEVIPVDILVRDRQAWLELGTLITDVLIPEQPPTARFGYERVSRTPRDRAIVAVAARTARDEAGCIVAARVAAGGVHAVAQRIESAESELNGRALNESEAMLVAETALRAVEPVGDWLASEEYRRKMTGVMVRRVLNSIRAGADS